MKQTYLAYTLAAISWSAIGMQPTKPLPKNISFDQLISALQLLHKDKKDKNHLEHDDRQIIQKAIRYAKKQEKALIKERKQCTQRPSSDIMRSFLSGAGFFTAGYLFWLMNNEACSLKEFFIDSLNKIISDSNIILRKFSFINNGFCNKFYTGPQIYAEQINKSTKIAKREMEHNTTLITLTHRGIGLCFALGMYTMYDTSRIIGQRYISLPKKRGQIKKIGAEIKNLQQLLLKSEHISQKEPLTPPNKANLSLSFKDTMEQPKKVIKKKKTSKKEKKIKKNRFDFWYKWYNLTKEEN